MKARFHRLTPREEARSLLSRSGAGDDAYARALATIERQLAVIMARAQVLVTVATLTLTITGFSGPRMAASGMVPRATLLVGIVLVLAALLLILFGSLQVRWLSQVPHDDDEDALVQAILYRKLKTRIFKAELVLLALGLVFYVTGIIAFLLGAPEFAVP